MFTKRFFLCTVAISLSCTLSTNKLSLFRSKLGFKVTLKQPISSSSDGLIKAVGPAEIIGAQYPEASFDKVIDASGMCVLPGEYQLSRGLHASYIFWDWIFGLVIQLHEISG